MANQPIPSRPWRLLLGNSLRPVPMAESPAQPQPQLQPQHPASRPIFRSKFGKPADTLPQQPPEPSPEAIALPRFRFGNASTVLPNPSQKTTPTPEKIKPITLEPIEQKTLLTQKPNPSNGILQKEVGDIEKPSVVLSGEKKREEAEDHKGNHKKVDSKDCGMLIITVAGDSKGATAELSATSKEPGTPLSFVNAFINSNVQTCSNSIIVDASVSNHDPGVHVFILRGDGQKK